MCRNGCCVRSARNKHRLGHDHWAYFSQGKAGGSSHCVLFCHRSWCGLFSALTALKTGLAVLRARRTDSSRRGRVAQIARLAQRLRSSDRRRGASQLANDGQRGCMTIEDGVVLVEFLEICRQRMSRSTPTRHADARASTGCRRRATRKVARCFFQLLCATPTFARASRKPSATATRRCSRYRSDPGSDFLRGDRSYPDPKPGGARGLPDTRLADGWEQSADRGYQPAARSVCADLPGGACPSIDCCNGGPRWTVWAVAASRALSCRSSRRVASSSGARCSITPDRQNVL
jgi:hypothetical protein